MSVASAKATRICTELCIRNRNEGLIFPASQQISSQTITLGFSHHKGGLKRLEVSHKSSSNESKLRSVRTGFQLVSTTPLKCWSKVKGLSRLSAIATPLSAPVQSSENPPPLCQRTSHQLSGTSPFSPFVQREIQRPSPQFRGRRCVRGVHHQGARTGSFLAAGGSPD